MIGACLALYVRAADYPMVFDDRMYLTDNPIFRDASNFTFPFHFTEFAQKPAKMGVDPDYAVNFIMRPVCYATFYLNYLFNGFQPRWFRVVNVVLHTGSTLLIYVLLHLLLGAGSSQPVESSSRRFIALTAALLFAVHPMAIESVTYIIQRFTSQVTFLYLLTLVLYFSACTGALRPRVPRVAMVITLLMAMLSKECAFTAPVTAVVLDVLMLRTPWKSALRRALPLLCCLPLIPVLLLLTTAAQSGSFDLSAAAHVVNSRDTPFTQWSYLLTQFTVICEYLRQLVWPTNLNIDPEWPLYESLFAAPVLRALAVLLLLAGGALWGWRRNPESLWQRAVLAFVVWFAMTISVSSSIVPLPDLMAEHRAYLASIGAFVVIAVMLDRARLALPQILRPQWSIPALATTCVVALSVAHWNRNTVWSDRVKLWTDTAMKSPNKYRVWGNLGAALSDEMREAEALECFNKALKIEPRFQNGIFNRANSLLRLGRYQESVETIDGLIKSSDPASKNPMALFVHGIGLAKTGRLQEAEITLQRCLELSPSYVEAHLVKALVHQEQFRFREALQHFEAIKNIRGPDTPPTVLASITDLQQRLDRASPRP